MTNHVHTENESLKIGRLGEAEASQRRTKSSDQSCYLNS